MKRDGQIQKLMTGGSIVHINIDSKITRSQAKRLIEDSVKFGMAHFALNACYIECQECGTVVKGYLDECPNCHSHHLNHYSRVIGYFSKVESWGKVRREKDFPNRKFLNPNDIKRELGD
jgi:ribonucleoside-triphosphate reductase